MLERKSTAYKWDFKKSRVLSKVWKMRQKKDRAKSLKNRSFFDDWLIGVMCAVT